MRRWKPICLIPLILTLSSCGGVNNDAASIRQAYIEEKEEQAALAAAEAARKADSLASGAAKDAVQAGTDISTAAKIGVTNVKRETGSFFRWAFDEVRGEWEYAKAVATCPNDELDELIANKDSFFTDESEFEVEEPEETALGYLAESETVRNAKDALDNAKEKTDSITENIEDLAEKAENESKDGTTPAKSLTDAAVESAGRAASRSIEEAKDTIIGAVKDATGEGHILSIPDQTEGSFSVPEFTGQPYAEINGNIPFFTDKEIDTTKGIILTELDSFGRCGSATEFVTPSMLPTEERGKIGMVKPSGWHQAKYDSLKTDENPAGYLYARCHLLAYCLSGLNAEPRNLITGTLTQFNVLGMEPFELRTLYYVRNTGHSVLYRVTPLFKGANLVADGVLMEAQSIEDDGLRFCVFVYNEPEAGSGVKIDHLTGISNG